MKKILLSFILGLAILGQGFSQTLKERLQGVPVFESIHNNPDGVEYGFKESYTFFVKQPIDHKNPGAGSFRQFCVICFRGFDKPTVFYTRGYEHKSFASNPSNDLADNLDANIVYLEHRYYGKSRIKGDDKWKYLTIRQSADDLHAVFQALQPILPEAWVSTGTSKDGNTAVFYSYFHPEDMNVTTAFCAPFQTTYLDERVGRYALNRCGTESERKIIRSHLNRMLTESFWKSYCDFLMKEDGRSEDDCPSYTSYVVGTLNTIFSLYSDLSKKERARVLPPEGASERKLFHFRYEDLDEQAQAAKAKRIDPGDEEYDDYLYTIQCIKELGTYTFPYQELKVLEGTSFDREDAEDPILEEEDEWLIGKYDNSVSKAILQEYLPGTKEPILLIYSANDPWTACRPTKVSSSVKVLINETGGHEADINDTDYFTTALRDQIMDFVNAYL